MSSDRHPAAPFERFRAFTKRLVAVPKKEIDRKATQYERAKQKRQKKPA